MRGRALLAAGALVGALALPGALARAAPPPTYRPGIPPPPDLSLLDRVNPTPHPQENVKPSQQCIDTPPGNTADNTIRNAPSAQLRLRIREAQTFSRGEGQTVAVIDTGVAKHPRLDDRLIDGGDFVFTQTGLDDCDGHGTIVAGIIAASADDQQTAFRGVAPEARILAIRQSSAVYKAGNHGAGTLASLAGAVMLAADSPGVRVINISEANCQPTPAAGSDIVDQGVLHAAVHYAAMKDIVVVVAAGNTTSQDCATQNTPGSIRIVPTPAWYSDDVLTVASIDENGKPSGFDLHGPWVGIAAPGTAIISLAPKGNGLTNTIADDASLSRGKPIQGTSFATPYVAGVAALVRARYPSLSSRQVIARLQQTAQHPAGGRDDVLGYGVVDPVAALTAVLPEEQGLTAPPQRSDRVAPRPSPPVDDTARVVALAGAAVGFAVLAVTGFVVYALRRSRRLHGTARAGDGSGRNPALRR